MQCQVLRPICHCGNIGGGGGYRMILNSIGFLVDHMVRICQIAHNFLESEIRACLGWVFSVGIIEEGGGGVSEYRVRVKRDCPLLG